MTRSKAYRSTEVKHVDLEGVIAQAVSGPVWVGVDVGKKHAFVVVRFSDGSFDRPWKVRNPSQIDFLVGLLKKLSEHQRLTVAMESTGTYGDPLRAELALAGLPVVRVSGKAASDHAETFDGVPSQHDGKDAAVVAELAAFGKSRPWPYRQLSEEDAELTYWVGRVDNHQRVENYWTGKLEAHLARHWPELTDLIGLTSVTLLSLMAHYGGPAALVADEEASRRLNQWGRGALKKTTLDEIVASAGSTCCPGHLPPTLSVSKKTPAVVSRGRGSMTRSNLRCSQFDGRFDERYIPGKRLELPDSQLPGITAQSRRRFE